MGRPNEFERARKLINLLPLVGERRTVSVQEIAQVEGVSLKEAQQLVKELWALMASPSPDFDYIDIVVDDSDDPQNASVTFACPTLSHPPGLSEKEVIALMIAFKNAGIEPGSTLMQRLLEAGIAADIDPESLARRFGVGASSGNPEILKTLSYAINRHRVVRVQHVNHATHRLSQRTLEPLNLYSQQGAWFLEAFCQEYNEVRTFRLDGIKSCTEPGAHFAPRDMPIADRHSPRAIDIEGKPLAYLLMPQVLFDSNTIVWPGLERADKQPGAIAPEQIAVTVPYVGTEWLPRQIISSGGSIEVLGPPELLDALKRLVVAMLTEAEDEWAMQEEG
jgi:predicted DNA-binding transcriptional regulator YafY